MVIEHAFFHACRLQLVACVTVFALAILPLDVRAQEPPLKKTPVFVAGHQGYYTYRIPALCVTPKGAVIAAAAGRYDSASDWANVDLVIRRSPDGGQTWLDQEILVNDGTNTVDNPTFIVDPKSGAVHLMYQSRYSRAYVKTSLDEGVTWSPPHEITEAFEAFRDREGYDWEVLAMGPGHGVTLRNGRMVVPIWLSTTRKHRPSISAVIYSDDGGQTWKAGDVIVKTTEETPNPSEHQLVELADSRVMSSIRTESPQHRRMMATSPDGATGWTKPEFVNELYEPICMASIVSVPSDRAGKVGKPWLVFCNPDSGPTQAGGKQGSRDRRNLTVKVSKDGGRTWPQCRTVEAGPSGYSDMAVAPDGAICLLYEAEAKNKAGPFVPATIAFSKFEIGSIGDDQAGIK
jgi:sialidase-1